jgi:hypothetical protein
MSTLTGTLPVQSQQQQQQQQQQHSSRVPLASIINKQLTCSTITTTTTTIVSTNEASSKLNGHGDTNDVRKENSSPQFDEVGNSRPKPTNQQSCTLPISSCLSKHGFAVAGLNSPAVNIENSSEQGKSKKKYNIIKLGILMNFSKIFHNKFFFSKGSIHFERAVTRHSGEH